MLRYCAVVANPNPVQTPNSTMTAEAVANTDLWGVAVPAWIGAVGSVAAAVVAAIAIIQSIRNQGGLKTLTLAVRDGRGVAPTVLTAPASDPVRWVAWHEQRSRYRLRNDAAASVAVLTSFADVTPSGDNAATTHVDLPVELAGQQSIPFLIEKTLASPAVTAIELTWREDDTEHTTVIYV